MTWSIIAHDKATGAFGIAAASRFFALGALVPWIKSGVGAVATQAMVNPRLGPNILKCLKHGQSANAALEASSPEETKEVIALGRHVRFGSQIFALLSVCIMEGNLHFRFCLEKLNK